MYLCKLQNVFTKIDKCFLKFIFVKISQFFAVSKFLPFTIFFFSHEGFPLEQKLLKLIEEIHSALQDKYNCSNLRNTAWVTKVQQERSNIFWEFNSVSIVLIQKFWSPRLAHRSSAVVASSHFLISSWIGGWVQYRYSGAGYNTDTVEAARRQFFCISLIQTAYNGSDSAGRWKWLFYVFFFLK